MSQFEDAGYSLPADQRPWYGVYRCRRQWGHRQIARRHVAPGGGGYSGYILVGVCPGTPKKGGLRCGHSPKKGVLGAGTAPKKGGLRCGHNQKKGGLRHVYNPKKGEFRTDLVRSCSKGGLGSLFMYYLYFYLTIWSTSGGVFWQADKGGS